MAAILHQRANLTPTQLFRRASIHCSNHPSTRTLSWPGKKATLADSDQIKDQVFSELQALIEESEKLLNDSAALVGEEADSLRAQVSLKLKQARQAAANMRDKAQPMVNATQDYIGGHPWQTVAISAGLGLVVGLLLGRRN